MARPTERDIAGKIGAVRLAFGVDLGFRLRMVVRPFGRWLSAFAGLCGSPASLMPQAKVHGVVGGVLARPCPWMLRDRGERIARLPPPDEVSVAPTAPRCGAFTPVNRACRAGVPRLNLSRPRVSVLHKPLEVGVAVAAPLMLPAAPVDRADSAALATNDHRAARRSRVPPTHVVGLAPPARLHWAVTTLDRAGRLHQSRGCCRTSG